MCFNNPEHERNHLRRKHAPASDAAHDSLPGAEAGDLRARTAQAREVWSATEANAWFATQPYRAGVNYIPAYAINTVELWQDSTFDIQSIEQEFALMESIGMNAVRVFLNDLVWRSEELQVMEHLEAFITAADRHDIGVMITFFTNGGKAGAKLGKQPEPNGTHNSGWMKAPDLYILADKAKWGVLERYVKVVVGKYAKDPRVICWDIFNEPGNVRSAHVVGGAGHLTDVEIETLKANCVDLIKASARWARECDPSQPITFGVWMRDDTDHGRQFNNVQYAESDIISYHSYDALIEQARRIKDLMRFGRPVICKEWMARNHGSTFNPILGYLKKKRVWSFAFGLVAGKMETWRPWPFDVATGDDSGVWFHDIFHADHTPYDQSEVDYIRKVMTTDANQDG